MKKYIISSILVAMLTSNTAFSLDLGTVKPVNPLENNAQTYLEEVNQPSFDLKKASLTKNSVKNQYNIAMDKFMQSNVRSSYQDFKILIDNVVPSDYVYMRLTREMAAIGFFNLAELAQSKIKDDEISSLTEEDVKNYYFPSYKLTHQDQIYLAEIYSQSDSPKDGIKYLNVLDDSDINTVIFDKELHSSQQYILYKTAKNDYWKKYHLAYYYYDENELNKAMRVLQTSISGKKAINKEVYALTAKVYLEMKEYEKAQDYALKSVDIDESNSTALTVLGDVAFNNKDYKLAETYYKKASGKDTTYNAEIKLAETYQKLNNEKKAKEIYAKILKVSSKAYESYYQMALIDKSRETTYLKKSIAINPNFKDGWIDLARVEISKDNYENAMSFLGVAKYIDDNDFRYYYYLGLVLKNKGLTAEANKNFEHSLEINPDYSLAKEELNI